MDLNNDIVLDKNIQKKENALQYFPVGLFGSTVALAGLGIAFKQSAVIFGLPKELGTIVAVLGWCVFLLLIVCYGIKFVRYPDKVMAELKHPVQANFLGTFFISAVLLAGLAVPYCLLLAQITWLAGALGGLVYMYVLTSRLFRGDLNVLDAVPPTLIPGLTVLNAATTGISMGFGWFGDEIDTIMFSLGIAYVFTFFVIISYRLVHRAPVIPFLVPTLLLMSAPFTVSFICYMTRITSIDAFGSVLFYFGFFIYVVLFLNVFKKGLKFMISWWGACFSTGALANASLKYAFISKDPMVRDVAGAMLVLLVFLITITAYLSLRNLFSGKLFRPS